MTARVILYLDVADGRLVEGAGGLATHKEAQR